MCSDSDAKTTLLLLVLLLVSLVPQAWSSQADPLWTEALRHIKAQQEWAAEETDEAVVTEGRSGERKTFRVSRLFDSRVDRRPRYKLEEVTPSSMTSEAETIRIDEIVAQGAVLRLGATATRVCKITGSTDPPAGFRRPAGRFR